jgi:hypothetical protein
VTAEAIRKIEKQNADLLRMIAELQQRVHRLETLNALEGKKW